MTEPIVEPNPLALRDRLHATLSEFNVADPALAVEAVCGQFTGWLRSMASDWHDEMDLTGYSKAAAILVQGLADGIEAGAPEQPSE